MICDDCKLVSICGRHISCNPVKVKSCNVHKPRYDEDKLDELTEAEDYLFDDDK